MLRRKTRKPGRYVVGLANSANDCFANSILQALAGVPKLYSNLTEICYLSPEAEEYAIFSSVLRSFLLQLNEPILEPKILSPWPVLRVLEHIYNSKLSRAQHDAHELLHLMLETLENEVDALQKYHKQHNLEFPVPRFAFEGSTYDELKCLCCGYTTNNKTIFLVLSLNVPQKRKCSLVDLLVEFQQEEIIGDYGCIRCRARRAIELGLPVANELLAYDVGDREYLSQENDGTRKEPKLGLDKLSEEVQAQLPPISVTISKSTKFGELPGVLCLHLSRSIFNGNNASRNSCRVKLTKSLVLDDSKGRHLFEFRCLVHHSGTHHTGHYQCSRPYNSSFWNHQMNQELQSSSFRHTVSRPPSFDNTCPSSQSKLGESCSLNGVPSSSTTQLSRLRFPENKLSSATPTTYLSEEQAQATLVTTVVPDTSKTNRARRSEPVFFTVSDADCRKSSLTDVLGHESAAYLAIYEKIL